MTLTNINPRPDIGLNLKDDISSIWNDSTFHDMTIVCADGVEISASRVVLASRCAVFKAMLYGPMRESISGKVELHCIDSAALQVVLSYLYTGTAEIVDSNLTIAVEVYRAASFLLLPGLMQMVVERAREVSDLWIAVSLFNETVTRVLWTDEINRTLLKAFCTHPLAIGDLTELSHEALELLLTQSHTMEFNTPEFDLLLCVVDWAWARNDDAQSETERHAILGMVKSSPTKSGVKILLGEGSSLPTMMQHMDLAIICPLRLKSLTDSIDLFANIPLDYMDSHVCNIECTLTHPSSHRGKPKLVWDRSQLGDNISVSDCGTTVASNRFPSSKWGPWTVRLTSPFVAGRGDGMHEWDIVVESIGSRHGHPMIDVGLVGEAFAGFCGNMTCTPIAWTFESLGDRVHAVWSQTHVTYGQFGTRVQSGDVLTFSLDMNKRTCAISINGWDYGVAWRDLPDKVYPAVTLHPQARYRVKFHSNDISEL